MRNAGKKPAAENAYTGHYTNYWLNNYAARAWIQIAKKLDTVQT